MDIFTTTSLINHLWLNSPDTSHGGRLFRLRTRGIFTPIATIFLYAFNTRNMQMLDTIFDTVRTEEADWDLVDQYSTCIVYLAKRIPKGRVAAVQDRDWPIMLYLFEKLHPEVVFASNVDTPDTRVDGPIMAAIRLARYDVVEALAHRRPYEYNEAHLYLKIANFLYSTCWPKRTRTRQKHAFLRNIARCIDILVRNGLTKIEARDLEMLNKQLRLVQPPFDFNDVIARRRSAIHIVLSRVMCSDVIGRVCEYAGLVGPPT